jgi:hypothetical protein
MFYNLVVIFEKKKIRFMNKLTILLNIYMYIKFNLIFYLNKYISTTNITFTTTL